MDSQLKQAHGKQGLFIEYSGRSLWGLGHVLSLAYALHYVCYRLRRYCYVKLWDLQLEDLFTYANGQGWAPTAAELAAYGTDVKVIKHVGKEVHNMPDLYDSLRNETAPLLHVKQLDTTPMIGSESMPWLLPLIGARRPGGGGGDKAIDRCFCRYVTQPSFGAEGEAALRAVAQRLHHGLPQGKAPIALHLRTGLADISDHEIASAASARAGRSTRHRAVGEARTWVRAACDEEAIRQLPAALVISDAPDLLVHLIDTFPQLYSVAHLAGGRTTAAAASSGALIGAAPNNASAATTPVVVRSTRSWLNGFSAKLESAVDMAAAGLMTEVHVSKYSSMLKPAVARSMCTRRVVPFDFHRSIIKDKRVACESDHFCEGDLARRLSFCPRFDVAFFRNMRVLTSIGSKWECAQQQLLHHPCKNVSGSACRLGFASAMSVRGAHK